MIDAGLFHPGKMAGRVAWFAADRITGLANGATMAQWSDVSGNANHAVQASAPAKPTYQTNVVNGLPAVRFSGAQWLTSTGWGATLSGTATPHTVSFVLRFSDLSVARTWFAMYSTTGAAFSSYACTAPVSGTYYYLQRYDNALGSAVIEEGLADTNWHIVTVRFNGTTLDAFIDGHLWLDAMPFSNGASTIDTAIIGAVGRNPGGFQTFFQGDVAEIVGLNRAATNQELTALHGYLGARFAIPLGTSGHSTAYTAPGNVEVLMARTASEMSQGLGFNAINSLNNQWMLIQAKAAGAVEVRNQFSWTTTEDVNTGALALTAAQETWLGWCATLGLKPAVVVAYGAPWKQILTLTTAATAAAGSYDITVTQDISQITPPLCAMAYGSVSRFVWAWAYWGAFIDSVNTATKTIHLAAKLNITIPAGSAVSINKLRYAPIDTPSPSHPSTAAYCRYAAFVAGRIAAHGLSGTVELWNEPPWGDDLWDVLPNFYDDPANIPGGNLYGTRLSANHEGILTNLATITAPPPGGVRYDHGGTHKSGTSTILKEPFTQAQLDPVIARQSFHPYGDSPEQNGWMLPDYVCNRGQSVTGNFREAVRDIERARPTIGPNFANVITETGSYFNTDQQRARHRMRQFLFWHGLNMKMVDFYCLAEGNPFDFINPVNQVPYPSFTMIQNFMAAINGLVGTPDAGLAAKIPRVQQWNGPWPLTAVPILCAGHTMLWCSWQRTWGDGWADIASPAPTSTYIDVPVGTTVVKAWDAVTGSAVTVTPVGRFLQYPVADNPVVIQLTMP